MNPYMEPGDSLNTMTQHLQEISRLFNQIGVKATFNRRKKKTPNRVTARGFIFGGADGTRTRDPRRDRPVF